MNFLPARRAEGRLETPLGSLDEPAELRRGGGDSLIAGFRPDHLALLDGDDRPEQGFTFETRAEVVEWLGGDLFVYFDVDLEGFAELSLPEDLDIETGGEARHSLVARIDPAAEIREGDRLRLGLDPGRVQLFDGRSGGNLTLDGAKEEP
jgi:multiple sugar transport system ATP-binding protein